MFYWYQVSVHICKCGGTVCTHTYPPLSCSYWPHKCMWLCCANRQLHATAINFVQNGPNILLRSSFTIITTLRLASSHATFSFFPKLFLGVNPFNLLQVTQILQQLETWSYIWEGCGLNSQSSLDYRQKQLISWMISDTNKLMIMRLFMCSWSCSQSPMLKI